MYTEHGTGKTSTYLSTLRIKKKVRKRTMANGRCMIREFIRYFVCVFVCMCRGVHVGLVVT